MRRPRSSIRGRAGRAIGGIGALLATLGLAAPAAAAAPASTAAVERALAAVYPALVNISAVTQQFAEGRAMRYPSAGSGVIVSPDGYVLTNFHVAGNSTRLRCTLTTGEVIDADVVAHDPLTDLSVLRLRLAARAKGAPAIVAAKLAEREQLEVGEPVLAMGNPFALSSSVTLGIVSNPRRVFTDFTGSELADMDLGGGETTGIFTQWIQHDALILPGNSGGPLVNLAGDVVGINELGGGGIGFAIPARVAGAVLRQALTRGRVERGFLGFLVLPVTKLARQDGALISAVLPGSPAEAAGVQPGDLLLALAGRPVAVSFFEQIPELYQRVAELAVGHPVELRIERSGTARTLSVEVAAMEKSRGDEAEFRELGLTAQEITGPMALARHLPPRAGLWVTGLRPGSPAASAKPPVEVGDLLVKVGAAETRELAALERALAADGDAPLLLTVRRDDQFLLAVTRLPEKRGGRWGGELPRAWLGVQTQVLTPDIATALGDPELHGFRVTQVYPWTQAEAAGLAVDDQIVALDGEPLAAHRVQDGEDLRRAIEEHSIGETVKLLVRRGASRIELPVALEARPEDSAETRRYRQEDLEFTVRDLTFLDRIDHHWRKDEPGALVSEVANGGWAQMAGLKVDDLIVDVGETAVADVAGFEKTMTDLVPTKPAVIRLFVRRGYRTHFVFVEPQWEKIAAERKP
ncbi:MAG: PDZ domain-containing protein [Thermoanaerobaculia bacterium]